MKFLNFVLLSSLTLLLQTARAENSQSEQPILKCWDQTFAYTRASVIPSESHSDLLHVNLTSESQPLFTELLQKPFDGWGEAEINFSLGKEECQSQEGRPDLMTCLTHRGLLSVAYDESFEVRKILRLPIADLKFTSVITKKATKKDPTGELEVRLSFRREGETSLRKVKLVFPTRDDKCL